jgi:hypothetical protein
LKLRESTANHGRGSHGPHSKWRDTDIEAWWPIGSAKNIRHGCRHGWTEAPPGRPPNHKASKTSGEKPGRTGCACVRPKAKVKVKANPKAKPKAKASIAVTPDAPARMIAYRTTTWHAERFARLEGGM